MKRGEHTPESIARRRKLNRHKKRYMELREELMLAGEIPTEPAGAIRDERVDPATQQGQSTAALTREAIRRGWAVPEEKKPGLVDELIAIIEDPDASHKEKVASFGALAKADWNQYRQDNPETAAKAVATVININVETVESRVLEVLPATDSIPTIEVVPIASTNGHQQNGTGVSEATGIPDQ